MYRHPVKQDATIANGGTTSGAIRLGGNMVVGLIFPAAFTGATVTFTGCDTATGTFVPIYDTEGNQVSVTVSASRGYGLSSADADALAPFPFIKIVSASAEAAERIIKVLTK